MDDSDRTSDTGEPEAAESALEAESDRGPKNWFEAVLNSITEEVYFTDRDRCYTYANPAALREFGHVQVEGVPLEQIVSQLDVRRADGTPRPLEEAPPLRALAGEVVRDDEQMVRNPRTGEMRHRQVSSAPVRNEAGEIIGAVSVVRDVTELRRINEALQSADRRKDEFLAMLAHELRNPLVPIRASVELLGDATERPEIVASVLPMMERQVAIMVRLIDDLLDVSRITSGRIELRPELVTVATLVGNAIEANRAAIAEGGFDLVLDLAEPHWTLNVDSTRMTQVISNILQNATKFTPPGGRITISSRMEASPEGSSQLALTVADSGVGISPTVLPQVFELFHQAGPPGQQTGLGIGLAVARRLVELHGGTVAARSYGPGRGSTFTVTIPAVAGLGAAEPHAAAPPSLADERVLIIDDNHDAADALAMLLEMMGATTRVTYGGEAGLDALQDFPASVVLLDIGMPGIDGYETCRRIRQRLAGGIRVIALSGWGQEQDKARAAAAGFDAHLTKPARSQQLAEAILGSTERSKPR
jgi:PAS domain S-box-containing protein